ncbi:carbohydrate-binding module family 18 protein [Rutstroemia sp. NJR-2017a BVV2]|nr:carbohydrate-binding module family 18 protein [Rutstroemia sp. NJR-2017a BVV2]
MINGTGLPAQDGRSLIKSWLSPRYLTCYSGYGLCPDNIYCCPLTDRCCGGGGCVEPGGKCCAGYTCDPGWNCCASPYCYPDGANCCSDGGYCPSGSVCVRISGAIKCSTTGGGSGPTLSATSAVFTAPPAETTIAVTSRTSVATITLPPVYEYYYFTITCRSFFLCGLSYGAVIDPEGCHADGFGPGGHDEGSGGVDDGYEYKECEWEWRGGGLGDYDVGAAAGGDC